MARVAVTLGRYLSALRPYRGSLLAATGLLVATASIPAVGVALVHWAVADLVAGAAELGWLSAVLAGLTIGHGAAVLARTWLTKRVAWDLAADLRRRVHRSYLRAAPGGVLGDRLSRLSDEIDQVQYGVSALVTGLRNPLTLLGLGSAVLWLAPTLAVVGGSLVGLVLAVSVAVGALVRRRARVQRAARADWLALTAAQLGALDALQAFGAGASEEDRFAEVTAADRDARLALEIARTVPRVAVQAIAGLALAGLLVASGAPGESAVRAEDLATLLVAVALAQRPLAGLAEVWALLQRSLGALERVEEAIDLPPRVVEPAEPRALPEGPVALRWEAVSWRVDGRAILRGVTLEARPGEILAVTGATGAGKSSLLRLAWRGVDPTSGRVLLGDCDLREVHPTDRHRAITLVPQDLVLWGRTLRENLTMGSADGAVDDPRLLEALEAARAVGVVPGGLDTVLAEGGRGLSGGERQRLAVARAFARRSRVWLLDEPTSHVDAVTTRDLGRALRQAAPGRTIVVVAHDPELLASADRVVELREGALCHGS